MPTLSDIQQRIRQEIIPLIQPLAFSARSLDLRAITTAILSKFELYLALCSETKKYNLAWLNTQMDRLDDSKPANQIYLLDYTKLRIYPKWQALKEDIQSQVRSDNHLFLEEHIIEPQYTSLCGCILRDELEDIQFKVVTERNSPFVTYGDVIAEHIDAINDPEVAPDEVVNNIEELRRKLMVILPAPLKHGLLAPLSKPSIPFHVQVESALKNFASKELPLSFGLLSRHIVDWIKYNDSSAGYDSISLFLTTFKDCTISYFFNTHQIPYDFRQLSSQLNLREDTPSRRRLLDNIEGWTHTHLINNTMIVQYLMRNLHRAAMLSLFDTLVSLYKLSTGIVDQKSEFIRKKEKVSIQCILFTQDLAVLAVSIAIDAHSQEPYCTPVLMSVNYHIKFANFQEGNTTNRLQVSYDEIRVVFSGPAKEKCHAFFLKAIAQPMALLAKLEKQAKPQWKGDIDGEPTWRQRLSALRIK